MLYIALGDFAAHLKRVKARAFAGGHPAPVDRLREIHRLSLANLAEAIQTVGAIQVLDNSGLGVEPVLPLEASSGRIGYRTASAPEWSVNALCGTAYDLML